MRTANASHYRKHMLDQCWADVEDGGTTLNQYSTNFGICQTGVCLGRCLLTPWKLVDNIGFLPIERAMSGRRHKGYL